VRPSDSVPWTRKHDDPTDPVFIAAGVGLRYYPESLSDLVQIVSDADLVAGIATRPCGSHWALSEAVAEAGFPGRIVETHGLNRTLYDVIPSCLGAGAKSDLVTQLPATVGQWDEAVYNLYHVEAGTRIYELYSRLDRQDPNWPTLPTDSLEIPALGGSWAPPTLGGAGGQTIIGAATTSTHGGDLKHPPIADMIQAVHLIGAGGRQFWIERAQFSARVPTPMSDADKLQQRLGPIEVIQDDDALNGCLVSVGRLGIIYSVVLKIVRQYGRRQTRHRQEWDVVQRHLLDPNSPLFSRRFLQVVVNPLPRFNDHRHSCWVSQAQAVPAPEPLPASWRGRAQRAGAGAGVNPSIDHRPHDLYTLICTSHINFAEPFEASLALLRDLAPAAKLVPFVGPRVNRDIDEIILELAKLSKADPMSLGYFLANVCNFLVDEGHGWLLPAIMEAFLEFGQGDIPDDHPTEDISYAMLDGWDYSDRDCITNADSIEVAFDASTDLAVRFINESLIPRTRQLIDGELTGKPMAFGGYASMRFTGRTQALIGIQKWDRTCIIEVAGLRELGGIGPLLDQLEADAKGMGATVHWGQRNHLTRADVEASYPTIDRWRNVLGRLSSGGDPLTFSSAYTRAAGLEPL